MTRLIFHHLLSKELVSTSRELQSLSMCLKPNRVSDKLPEVSPVPNPWVWTSLFDLTGIIRMIKIARLFTILPRWLGRDWLFRVETREQGFYRFIGSLLPATVTAPVPQRHQGPAGDWGQSSPQSWSCREMLEIFRQTAQTFYRSC